MAKMFFSKCKLKQTLLCFRKIGVPGTFILLVITNRPSGISQKKIWKLRGTYKKLCGIARHYEPIARQIAQHFVFVITPYICRIMKENMFNNN